jgi:hypothetical protein
MNFDENSRLDKSFVLKEVDSKDIFKREIAIDNKLLGSFFSNADGLYAEESIDDNFDTAKKIDELYYIIDRMLPEIEKQIVILLFFYHKKQEIVGKVLKISQEMVCYYKKRAISRIKLHFFLRSINIDEMEVFLHKYVTKKQKIAMLEYFKEHDLRKIAVKIAKMENRKDIHYEAIGSRIKLGMKKLEKVKEDETDHDKHLDLYLRVFKILNQHNSLYTTQSKKKVSFELKG